MAKIPEPHRLVVDADVLVADLFIDDAAREAMTTIRSHPWLELRASEQLLDDAAAIITELGDSQLAGDWRAKMMTRCQVVKQPSQDHPGLATAYAGNAGHLLTYDPRLTSADTGMAMRRAMPISIRTPDAFNQVFDVAALYEAVFDAPYPGPEKENHD